MKTKAIGLIITAFVLSFSVTPAAANCGESGCEEEGPKGNNGWGNGTDADDNGNGGTNNGSDNGGTQESKESNGAVGESPQDRFEGR